MLDSEFVFLFVCVHVRARPKRVQTQKFSINHREIMTGFRKERNTAGKKKQTERVMLEEGQL